MVKVQEEPSMAEGKASSCQSRKPRAGQVHFHPPLHHLPFHHYCYYSTPGENHTQRPTNGASSTPAKFYFGPGFEPQIDLNSYGAGPSRSNEHVVLFHVNPGVVISLQVGNRMEVLTGPVTVPMVSTNPSPPIAMPVQVPPGHVVQQIVDESGTLRHVILSPQHPGGVMSMPSHHHYGAGPPNGTNQPPQAFYQQGIPPGFPPPHFHNNIPPGHAPHGPSPTHPGPSPPPYTYYKDERTQKLHSKLKKKVQDKQQRGDTMSPRRDLVNGLKNSITKDKGMNSVGTSEDGEENSSVQDDEDSLQVSYIQDLLSSVQAPLVSELSSRSALLQWALPLRLTEAPNNDTNQELEISENDLRYEVFLSDKSKEMKYKSIYNGTALSCLIQDLRPGQEYSACVQVHWDEFAGAYSDCVKFTTPPCEPDQPQPPKLIVRTKNSLQLRWNQVNDNGSHILYYILEYDEGKGGEFIEICKCRGKQHILQKLNPATAYKFRLAAQNDVGKSAYSDVVIYDTFDNPPTQPQAPNLKEASVNSLRLTWQKRPKDDEFQLKMDEMTTGYGYMVIYNGPDTEYLQLNLKTFTEYKFKLRAQNEGGPSPWSEEVTFMTLPDRPMHPTKPVVKGRIHAHSFRLKWDPPTNTGGAEINQYILEVNSGSGYKMIYSGKETEAICDNLTPGTTYQLRVSCISDGGHSNYSDPCTVTTEAVSPGQCSPPRLVGKPRSTSITLRWGDPQYNGGAPVLEYELEMEMPDASRHLVHKNKELECTVSDLKPGCKYSFKVRAINRIGAGPWSDTVSITSGAAPPDAPATPVATCKSPSHINVEWQVPHNNGAPITEYRLELSPSDNEDQFLSVFQGCSTSYDVKNLMPFSPYFFRVQACNNAGYGAYSPIAATITPSGPPSTITLPRCESTPTSIAVMWNEPANNGSSITHYVIEIGDQIITTDGPINKYTIESLMPDTTYKIKVQAVNAVGAGSFSPVLKTSTLRLPPASPRLECVGIGHNYLKLKWADGKNQDYTQYCVEMEGSRTREYYPVYKGTSNVCKVNKLQELTTYNFRINASNDAGVGDYSKVYEFTTNMAPPPGLKAPKATEVEQKSCLLEWTPSKSIVADPILYLLQVTRLKDQDFKQVYKGPETKFCIDSLEPGAEYCARVCCVRVASTGELQGPFSPVFMFSTLPQDPSCMPRRHSTAVGTPMHNKQRNFIHNLWLSIPQWKHMKEETKNCLLAFMLAVIGILLAALIIIFYPLK